MNEPTDRDLEWRRTSSGQNRRLSHARAVDSQTHGGERRKQSNGQQHQRHQEIAQQVAHAGIIIGSFQAAADESRGE